ncbi:INO80 complex subunit D-like isoform X1 [Paramormyrops kingsleyae]|uniref:INO80 complex subunit D-like isoform X1 n=2 Tax=Paramormyrops kingsleyae TaxID=1676925 RepID=UPI003B96A67F
MCRRVSYADVLRDQSHVMFEGKHIHFSEVDNKPLCSYSPKLCKQRRLNGYAFCIRHVLEDKTAPFKQCEYVAKYNSQRCTNPIPKSEDRRYCNSHLQVLGFIPKKERKKKQEVVDEVRLKPRLESVALNIVVPSLALKAHSGLDTLAPCLPSGLPLEASLLDPFAFCEDETDGEEGSPQKSSVLAKELQRRPALNQPQKLSDLLSPLEHFSPSPLPSQGPPSPRNSQLPPQQPQSSSHLSPSGLPGLQQGQLCKPALPDSQPQPNLGSYHSPEEAPGHVVTQKATPMPGSGAPGPHIVVLRPSTFLPSAACLERLRRLAHLCCQRRQLHGDLFPHLGLDWSEDSEEDESERPLPSGCTLRLHERCLPDRSDAQAAPDSRSSRLARLCGHLQLKYRQDRAATRHRSDQRALRVALLRAACRDPHCTGQLLQELRRPSSTQSPQREDTAPGSCAGGSGGQACHSRALPFTRHCFQHILQNRSQQLFSSCTARFADGQQCSVPVFDITHQTPLCQEHAKKMDDFLRGDSNRRMMHQQQQQQHKPRKIKQPTLGKKHKKKHRRAPRRPQKPIPPALPQGDLAMPTSLSLPTQAASLRSPDLSIGQLHDDITNDITNDITDIPHDLELNQEDFSDVLPRLPDDLQDFDIFEGKNGDLLPTTEEAEELVRALQAMGSYPDSLACLGSIGELAQTDTVDSRPMSVFSGSGGQAGTMGDLLNGRIATESFPGLDLEDSLLRSPVAPPHGPAQSPLAGQPFQPHLLADPEPVQSSPHGSHYSSEPVPSPYSEHMASPRPRPFSAESPLLLEVPLSGVSCPARSSWSSLPLSLTDPQFSNLVVSDGHLISTSLSTPPSTAHLVSLPVLPPGGLTSLPMPPACNSSPSSSFSVSAHGLPTSSQPKLQLPQFSAAFGHQLASHCGIPKDIQPSHSSTAPPTGFSTASTAAGAGGSAHPFSPQ